jgi:hypothetical protein
MKKSAKVKADRQIEVGSFRLDLANFVPYRISILGTLIRRALSEVYRENPGLTETEWKVLTKIAHKGPLPSGDIGLHMTLNRTAISRARKQMIKLKPVALALMSEVSGCRKSSCRNMATVCLADSRAKQRRSKKLSWLP